MNKLSAQLTVTRESDPITGLETSIISFPSDNPPDVYFDTGVWIGMAPDEEESLKAQKIERQFRYRYSVTNYVELLSRLGRGPTSNWPDPFVRVRAAFRRIRRLCHPEILPAPEMAFLASVGMSHYLDRSWMPNIQRLAFTVDLIAKAETLGDITGKGIRTIKSIGFPRCVVNPSHYSQLTQTDEASVTTIIEGLSEYVSGPLTKENVECLLPWFMKLAGFFLLFRASNGRTSWANLRPEERDQFMSGFISGVGQMFQMHILLMAKRTLNWTKKIDPNDLYDAMQLLLLQEGRLFVTGDTNFFRHSKDSFVTRVVPWEAFKQRP